MDDAERDTLYSSGYIHGIEIAKTAASEAVNHIATSTSKDECPEALRVYAEGILAAFEHVFKLHIVREVAFREAIRHDT